MSERVRGHGSKFSRKKEEAIQALCTQRTIDEAAQTVGVGTATLSRWMKLPEFREAYLEARREALSQANARMQRMTGVAVATLVKIMVDAEAPPAARVRAADPILSGARQALELEDIEVRLAALERARETERRQGGK